jgi:hypothetical protein
VPSRYECHLHRVRRQIRITQDAERDLHALVADLPDQGGEGILVAVSRPLDQVCKHRAVLVVGA